LAERFMGTLESEIIDFAAHETGVKANKVALSTRLLQDLGMDGDDAVEFFDLFSDKFKVDLSQLSQHWHHHFGPEGFLHGLPFRGLEMEITIQDLLDAAIAGRWLKGYRGEEG
jgi:acyl carrier protein